MSYGILSTYVVEDFNSTHVIRCFAGAVMHVLGSVSVVIGLLYNQVETHAPFFHEQRLGGDE